MKLNGTVILLWVMLIQYAAAILVAGRTTGDGDYDKEDSLESGYPSMSAGTSGALYTRWGRTECHPSSSLVYAGLAGGKGYINQGGGSNYLCLPEDPDYDVYQAGLQNGRSHVYSAEYQPDQGFPPYAHVADYDVPCAVCRATNRGTSMMIPAKNKCPQYWTHEYHGYLMSAFHGHPGPTEFVCVDGTPDVVPGSAASTDGALFYPVEGRCDGGTLPCSTYINGAELTCVVCTI